MKITQQKCHPRPTLRLQDLDAGQTCRFVKAFSDRHVKTDVFIVNSVCNTYVPETIKRGKGYPYQHDKYKRGTKNDQDNALHPHAHDDFGKLAVTNLRTGSLSYVAGCREISFVNAEVCDLGGAP